MKLAKNQQQIGKANEHVMSAFESLRMLKLKVLHAKHHCTLAREKVKSLSQRMRRLEQDVEDSSVMIQKALKHIRFGSRSAFWSASCGSGGSSG